MNRKLINAFAASVLCITANAWADGPSCNAAAAEKKLAGAAKSSFTKKCVKDAVGA